MTSGNKYEYIGVWDIAEYMDFVREQRRGIVHTDEWVKKMERVQKRWDQFVALDRLAFDAKLFQERA